ncbi:hypothetical protein cyc_08068 [Cyclospora cayetanensis]|uniref:Uncharacterized protein n=1 Tax=Cyclospora cayetanensis TaxID=88456 RepID=A0A1D3CRQ7_9EIME|nr:hypothetical protein cyc_08068 [Cyclospora cayetanensis]
MEEPRLQQQVDRRLHEGSHAADTEQDKGEEEEQAEEAAPVERSPRRLGSSWRTLAGGGNDVASDCEGCRRRDERQNSVEERHSKGI